MYNASDLISGTWNNVVGPTASWISNQNSDMRGFCLFVDGYGNENGGRSILYENNYYYEWGYTFEDTDLDGIFEVSDAYSDLLGDEEGFVYVSEDFDQIVGRYFSTTSSDDRPADNGTWDRFPNRSEGEFSGDELGIFEIDVPLDFSASSYDDEIVGTTLGDSINLLGGNDFVDASSGNDVIKGGNGNDQIIGGYGNDRLFGGNHNDILEAGFGNDRLSGGNGSDRLFGGNGSDHLFGGNGIDRLTGGSGNDSLSGGNKNDRLSGGNGSDRLSGGNGSDRLFGGNGIDRLTGGVGNDTLRGGGGNDIFQINSGVGRDVITDYISGDDRIKLLGGITENDLTFSYLRGHTRIKDDEGDLLAIVQNTIVDDITFF